MTIEGSLAGPGTSYSPIIRMKLSCFETPPRRVVRAGSECTWASSAPARRRIRAPRSRARRVWTRGRGRCCRDALQGVGVMLVEERPASGRSPASAAAAAIAKTRARSRHRRDHRAGGRHGADREQAATSAPLPSVRESLSTKAWNATLRALSSRSATRSNLRAEARLDRPVRRQQRQIGMVEAVDQQLVGGVLQRLFVVEEADGLPGLRLAHPCLHERQAGLAKGRGRTRNPRHDRLTPKC